MALPLCTYDFLTEEWDRSRPLYCLIQGASGELERDVATVMDYKNKAIVSPDTRAVSDTRMRCLTMCLTQMMTGPLHLCWRGLAHSDRAAVEEACTQEVTREEAAPPKRLTTSRP